MKYLSTSILSIKDNLIDNIKIIDEKTDYIHIDIMDGIFVNNNTWDINTVKLLTEGHKKPLDVHLMVSDVKKYIDDFSLLKPEYITIHLESTNKIDEVIEYIKNKGIKVGLSIKPSTDVSKLYPFLKKVDLILIMSVEPGFGGQKFLDSATIKIDRLKELRTLYEYNYKIEVDGGVNLETLNKCINSDLFVVGSYITSSNNYEDRIDEINKIIKA